MSNFSVNQNRQMYVVKGAYQSSALSTTGDIMVKSINEGIDKAFYFMYQGADTALKSDIIPVKTITQIEGIKASAMRTVMRKFELTLVDAAKSNGNVLAQDYVLGINFKGFFSPADASQYYKDAAVRGNTSMSASDFYKSMVNSLNLAFSREDGATSTSNPYLSFAVDDTTTATKIIITEKVQPWTLGIKKQRRVMFDILPSTIYSSGADIIWGTVTEVTPAKASTAANDVAAVGNGRAIADLEWFCMGERGDQYKDINWPNSVKTQYLVDPSKEYNLLEIHFAFTDDGVSSYRSEKQITLAFPMGASGHEYDVINAVIDAIETATGLTIAGLS